MGWSPDKPKRPGDYGQPVRSKGNMKTGLKKPGKIQPIVGRKIGRPVPPKKVK